MSNTNAVQAGRSRAIKWHGNRPVSVHGFTVPWQHYDKDPARTITRACQMAAAPDLIENLKAMLRLDPEWARVDPVGFAASWEKNANIARAAIARAEGL